MAKILSTLARLLASVLAPAAITAVCYGFLGVNATTVAMFYLVAVLLIAASFGILESAIAAIVSVLCFNFFFLPPVLTFTIADPQNWVALFTFLAAALIGSQLSSYAKKQTQKVWDSKRETEQLYSLSRAILLLDEHQSAAAQIARHIVRVFGFANAVIFDRSSDTLLYGAGAEAPLPLVDRLKQVAGNGTTVKDAGPALTIAPIRLGTQPIASIALQGLFLSDGAQQALLNLIAITLERERHREQLTQAQAERKSERLKSTLLDAIAHEFKTPLTSIKIAAGSLLSPSLLPVPAGADPVPARELATVIDEEADRLTGLVEDAIQMARIEAGTLNPKKGLCKIDELVYRALQEVERRRDGRRLDVRLSNEIPAVPADPDLLGLTLKLLLDNALKYSPPLTPISISAARQDGMAMIRVHDEGPGIAESDQAHVFEKFYRGGGVDHQVPGTGMGLPIAREIARAHGGDLWVESNRGEGTTFVLTIPVEMPL